MAQWLNVSSFDAQQMFNIGIPRGIISYSQHLVKPRNYFHRTYKVDNRLTWKMPNNFVQLEKQLADPFRSPGCPVVLDIEDVGASYWNYPGIKINNRWTITEKNWQLSREGKEFLRQVIVFMQKKYPHEVFTYYGSGAPAFSSTLGGRIEDVTRDWEYGSVGPDDNPRYGLADAIPLSAMSLYMRWDENIRPHLARLNEQLKWYREKHDKPAGGFFWFRYHGGHKIKNLQGKEIPAKVIYPLIEWADKQLDYVFFWSGFPYSKHIEPNWPDRKTICEFEWCKAFQAYQYNKADK